MPADNHNLNFNSSNSLRALVLGLLIALSGCSILQKTPTPVETEPPTPRVSEPPPETTVEPPPPPPVEVVKIPPTPALDVAIIISRDIGRYHALAAEIGITISEAGGNFRPYYLYQNSQQELIQEIKATQHRQVAAIGLQAAKATDQLGNLPVVFCQVYNYQEYNLINEQRKGVSLVPSIEKQFAAWKKIIPSLQRVGVIIGTGKQSYLAETEKAASENGITLLSRSVQSDKELWLEYRHMIHQVDAFWLLPDNRILSKRVLRDMVSYSLKHDTPLFTINGLLLQAGALISAAQVNRDVASITVNRLNSFSEASPLPGEEVASLNEARIMLNTQVLNRFNIMIPEETNTPDFEKWPSSQVTATIDR